MQIVASSRGRPVARLLGGLWHVWVCPLARAGNPLTKHSLPSTQNDNFSEKVSSRLRESLLLRAGRPSTNPDTQKKHQYFQANRNCFLLWESKVIKPGHDASPNSQSIKLPTQNAHWHKQNKTTQGFSLLSPTMSRHTWALLNPQQPEVTQICFVCRAVVTQIPKRRSQSKE